MLTEKVSWIILSKQKTPTISRGVFFVKINHSKNIYNH